MTPRDPTFITITALPSSAPILMIPAAISKPPRVVFPAPAVCLSLSPFGAHGL